MSRLRSPRFLICLVALSAPLAGCTATPLPPGDDCPGDPVASVVLNIRTPAGPAVPAADITFKINGGDTFEGPCAGNCGSVALAFNIVGTFNITVKAPGFNTDTRNVIVPVASDGCHPVTQNVTIGLVADPAVSALAGAWETNNLYGRTILRFGDAGQIIGAILFDRVVAGDGNIYVAYNGNTIAGAPGQTIIPDTASNPTRFVDTFNFGDQVFGNPIGFENAVMTNNFLTLTGTLSGITATYTRLAEIPAPLTTP